MSLTSDPTTPLANTEVTFDVTTPAAHVRVFELTSRPSLSEVPLGLLVPASVRNRTFTSAAEVVAAVGWETLRDGATLVPDCGGRFTFKAYDFQVRPPVTSWDETERTTYRLKATTTETLDVGQAVRLPIRSVTGDNIELRLVVQDETIKIAELGNASTVVAHAASTASTVVAALAALEGQPTSVIPALDTIANDLRQAFEAHRVYTTGSVHGLADTVSVTTFYPTFAKSNAVGLVRELLQKLVRSHMIPGTTAPRWHAAADDTKNVPCAAEPGNAGDALIACIDARWRVFTRHLSQTASPAAHGAADAVNTLAVSKGLFEAFVEAWFDVIAATAVNWPSDEPEGALDLAARGFTIEPS